MYIHIKRYAKHTTEENPLYLFDRWFDQNVDGIRDDWGVPSYCKDDLFSRLGEDQRPDYRWLIIGAARSGSNFHIDPNGTVLRAACLYLIGDSMCTLEKIHTALCEDGARLYC